MRKTKQLILLSLAGALVSILLLAMSLSNLQLQPGTPFPGSGDSENSAQPVLSLPPIQTYSFPALQGLLALISLFLVIYVSARLIAFVNIRKVLPFVLALVALLIIVFMLPNIIPDPSPSAVSENSEVQTPPSIEHPVAPVGDPPQLLIRFVIIGIVLGGGLIAILMIKRWSGPTKLEDELLQDAEEAVKALQDGMDLRDVVVRCYMQMIHTVQKERGVERNHTMTVQEFEHQLESIGFPTTPLQQLTSLFERVRYGKKQVKDIDEQIAMESLNAIIKFCQSKGV
jgi:hypothetical protein